MGFSSFLNNFNIFNACKDTVVDDDSLYIYTFSYL